MDKVKLYRLRATQAQAMGLLEIAVVFSDAAEEVNRLRVRLGQLEAQPPR